jgi:hypothetical protein
MYYSEMSISAGSKGLPYSIDSRVALAESPAHAAAILLSSPTAVAAFREKAADVRIRWQSSARIATGRVAARNRGCAFRPVAAPSRTGSNYQPTLLIAG